MSRLYLLAAVRQAGASSAASASRCRPRASQSPRAISAGCDHALAINQTLYSKLPYNALKDLDAISKLGISPSVVVVNNKLPVNNIKELLALAKKEPGKLSFGSSGNGGAPHLSAEVFAAMSQTQLLHVPYKGGGAAMTDLIAGTLLGA